MSALTPRVDGFKATDADVKCQGHAFEVGKPSSIDGDPELCNRGFHFCTDPLDVLRYYSAATSRFFRVVAEGVTDAEGDCSKRAARRITLTEEIDLHTLITESVAQRVARAKGPLKATSSGYGGAATSSGDYGAATSSGYGGAATSSGDYGAATSSGDYGAATSSGYGGAATSSGDGGAATSSGDGGAATSSGYGGAATSSGDGGAATSSGDYGAATSSGYGGAATSSGDYGAATSSGDHGAAIAAGDQSIAHADGIDSKARGALGTWLTLSEWQRCAANGKYERVGVVAIHIDGDIYQPDTWYTLRGGKVVAA